MLIALWRTQNLYPNVIINKPHQMIEDGGYSKPVVRASVPFPEKGSWEDKSLYALELIGRAVPQILRVRLPNWRKPRM
jgi:hypothetical protein